MPSSTSSSDADYWVRPMAERVAPAIPWGRALLVALLVILLGVGGWEVAMRRAGMVTDIGDSTSAWARERRKVDAGQGRVVIVGSSRLQFDVDLARWQKLTGVKPIQLAMRGTTPRPIITDLAKDPRFKGLLIVGYDPLVFFGPPGAALELVKAGHSEPLYKRFGLVLYDSLARVFAFLDRDYTLLSQIQRLPVGQRTKMFPASYPWKMSDSGPDRETWLWPRLVTDHAARDRAAHIWMTLRGLPPKPGQTEKAIDQFAQDVAAIRARGGQVILVRSPSDEPLLGFEEQVFPRHATWDVLLATSHAPGIYYADEPSLAGFHTVEYSHLARADRVAYTDALQKLVAARISSHAAK